MQTLIFLYILGVNIFQATGNVNSTQMYYINLIIEQHAIGNITKFLVPFVINTNVNVDNVNKTTFCKNVTGGTQCRCLDGYVWSDKVCQSTQTCCGNNNCTFSSSPLHMCIANTTVVLTGSITLDPQLYQDCLADQSTNDYFLCNHNVTTKMQAIYSRLMGFDVLNIISYRVGSIIANFQVIIVSDVSSEDLRTQSTVLINNLSATLNLQTAGIVRITMPPNPVCYTSQHVVTCTSQDDLKTDPVWQLQNQGTTYVITNGTQAQVTSVPMLSTVNLSNITELWEGEYTCAYSQMSNSLTITHKASAVMSVSLLPTIYITTNPSYPRCITDRDLLNVQANCQITPSNESYVVTWGTQNIGARIIPNKYSTGQAVYSATTVVNCNSSLVPQVTCTFMNRCNQTRNATININIIKAGDPYCPATADGWQDTKAECTAVLQCTNAAGQRQRQCSAGPSATWGVEDSRCVNQDLYNVLQKALIVDIGLGSLDNNTAIVFNQLQVATNNTLSINTFPNLDTSVQVLSSLSQKPIQINNQSAVNDFLESSSNLLEQSLQNSWTKNNTNNITTLAETYLSSFEQLIDVTNLTSGNKKPNIEVATCSGSQCYNTVFNVNVTLSSSNNGNVKTAGFQQLQNYLPNNEGYIPNSIVVSTVTEEKQLDSVQITIDFPLLSPRPPNVEIMCVSWDNNSRRWSSDGCEWKPSENAGRCVCTHLSSFAILMSRVPLELPGMTEITYVGLSVSIVSLIAVLIIELIVWSSVVKTNTLYLRHTAHVNISLSLLVADCCFLACSPGVSELWAKTFVVLKHFCYLSMFFWMLCLSCTLLHQAVFLFHSVSKKNYLRFSLVLGYVCPFLIVFITVLTNQGGAAGLYFNKDTCWLVYVGVLQGSIFTFLIPVGIIIFINMFSMLVVIMKLVDHPKSTEKTHEKDKTAAKTVMRTVVLLTPIFGITWAFGFGVMILDLTSGPIAYAVNYAFTLTNAFQGFFILVTTCLGDKMMRETLLHHLKKNAPLSTEHSESTSKLESSWKK